MSDIPEIPREYRVDIVPADAAEPVDLNDRARRTKFAGSPDQIQPQGHSGTVCPSSGNTMRFIGQIDPFQFNGKDNPNRKDYGDKQFMFGDVGMIYVRFCFDCRAPLATMDCY